VDDGFAVFEEVIEVTSPAPRGTRLTKAQLDALAVLNLEEGATLHDIKARYKELVKRFHPDANGGSRGTEERLRQVIRAYGHLRATGLV
jgi:preprotein translocase subunit Sec63